MTGRSYRQVARAETVQATRRRIVGAFFESVREKWIEEITLDQVAKAAGVTVRTVIRQFGGKDGLIAGIVEYLVPEVNERRTVTPGDIGSAIDRLFDNYEAQGDITLRSLMQEGRYPALKPTLDAGRRGHRAIAAHNFAPWLDRLEADQRRRALDALVIATDIYTWKLLRQDMGRSEAEAKATVRGLVEAVLARFAGAATKA